MSLALGEWYAPGSTVAAAVREIAVIPAFQANGILPPFVGDVAMGRRAPYRTTMPECVVAFGTLARRRVILRGLLAYRAQLRAAGVAKAFQWLDGRFVEELSREPNDVDVVTLAEQVPIGAALLPHRDLFLAAKAKASFHCDGYFVQLGITNRAKVVERTAYWYGLFSHRRGSLEWKGLVEVQLDDAAPDAQALKELDRLDAAGKKKP